MVTMIGLLAWAYQALCPPPPRLCGTPNGPPIIGPRIKLRDGRHLAYFEQGVSRESAKHKIIFLHRFASTKYDTLNVSSLLQEIQAMQQGEYESLYRDMMVGFGKWEFSPMDIENPFPNNEGAVHLWQGDDDQMIPVSLQRFIVKSLPWNHYHEVPGSGHLFPLIPHMTEAIMKILLDGDVIV